MPHAHLHRARAGGMRGDPLAAAARHLHDGGQFLVGDHGRIGAGAPVGKTAVAGDVDLERVDALACRDAAGGAPPIGRIAGHGEPHLRRQRKFDRVEVAEVARRRHLLRRRAQPRPGETPRLDRVAHHDIEPRFCCRRAEAAGEPLVQQQFCIFDRQQQVFFDRDAGEFVQVAAAGEAQMRVCLGEPRHQRAPGAVDHLGAGARQRLRRTRDGGYAIVLHQHFAHEGKVRVSVDDPHVGE